MTHRSITVDHSAVWFSPTNHFFITTALILDWRSKYFPVAIEDAALFGLKNEVRTRNSHLASLHVNHFVPILGITQKRTQPTNFKCPTQMSWIYCCTLVVCWITDHYHLSSNLSVGIFEGCFIFDFASLPLEVTQVAIKHQSLSRILPLLLLLLPLLLSLIGY